MAKLLIIFGAVLVVSITSNVVQASSDGVEAPEYVECIGKACRKLKQACTSDLTRTANDLLRKIQEDMSHPRYKELEAIWSALYNKVNFTLNPKVRGAEKMEASPKEVKTKDGFVIRCNADVTEEAVAVIDKAFADANKILHGDSQ